MRDDNIVCTVVLTHNRKVLLCECLTGCINQTRTPDHILIVDNNSSDGTQDKLTESGFISSLSSEKDTGYFTCQHQISTKQGEACTVHYVRIPTDTGSAGGYYEGIRRACSLPCNWIWIMDDDAEPDSNCLKSLLVANATMDAGCLLSTVKTGDRKSIQLEHRGFHNDRKFTTFCALDEEAYGSTSPVEVTTFSWIGVLLRRDVAIRAGLPLREYFMFCEDLEYSMRVTSITKTYLVTNSVMYHKSPRRIGYATRHFLGVTYSMVPISGLASHFYVKRNLVDVERRHNRSSWIFALKIIARYLFNVICIVLFESRCICRLIVVTTAFRDGISRHFDNDTPSRLLNK